jgi:cytochrome c biogenesis protein CcmG/thiol:disulfide interchange protein DsbE
MHDPRADESYPSGGSPARASGRRPRGLGVSVVALAVAIAGLVVLGIAATKESTSDRPSPRASGVTGAAADPVATPREGLHQNRREANRLIDTSLDAKLASLKGVPVVVNQWASWCPPCRAEFGFFADLAEQYDGRVAFVGLNSRDERGAAEAFLKEHPVSYPSVFDEDAEQARSVGAGLSWPTTVFVNRSGEVVFIRRGGYADASRLDADIRAHVLGGSG